MDDPQIHGTIEQRVAEEHELWERESAGRASPWFRVVWSHFPTSRCTELPP